MLKKWNGLVPLLCLGGIFLFHAAGNHAWLRENRIPPHDDQAIHLSAALKLADSAANFPALLAAGLKQPVGDFMFYPPLFHMAMAASVKYFGRSDLAAVSANLPFLLILLAALYFTGKKAGSPGAGILAGCLVMLYPYVFDLSRLPLPDFALLAMVAASFCLLLYTDDFSRRPASIAFGLSLGLGMMTKQVFIAFLLPAVLISAGLALMRRGALRRTAAVNGLYAAAAAVAGGGYWYLSRFAELWRNYLWVAFHEDPAICSPDIGSLKSLLFYPSVLLERQMLAFFVLLFCAAFLLMWFAGREALRHKLLLTGSILGSFGILQLIYTKEPKTTAPALVFFALISASGIMALRSALLRRILIVAAVAVGVMQYFDMSYAPNSIITPVASRIGPNHNTPGASPIRIGGTYKPVGGDFRVEEICRFIRRRSGRQEPTVALFIATLNSPEKQQLRSNLSANYSAFKYACLREGLPFAVAALENTPADRDFDFAVVSDYMNDVYRETMRGQGREAGRVAARFLLSDNSSVFVYETKRTDAVRDPA